MRLINGKGDRPEPPDEPRLPLGYRLDRCSDPDVLVLRRAEGSVVARFSVWGTTREAVEFEAEKDYEEQDRPACLSPYRRSSYRSSRIACVSASRPFSEVSRLRAAANRRMSRSGYPLSTSSKKRRTSGRRTAPFSASLRDSTSRSP